MINGCVKYRLTKRIGWMETHGHLYLGLSMETIVYPECYVSVILIYNKAA